MAHDPQQKRLLIVTPTVGFARDKKGLWFDRKFVEGMSLYRDYWPGPVAASMKIIPKERLDFGRYYTPEELPFTLIDEILPDEKGFALLNKANTLLASADDHNQFWLAERRSEYSAKLAYVIEYTLETRLDIIRANNLPLAVRSKRSLQNRWTERARVKAIKLADAIQANGRPAFNAYGDNHANGLCYFDCRTPLDMMPTEAFLNAKIATMLEKRPLKLAFSGRWEPMKGVDHLPHMAKALKQRGIDFTLSIFGQGSLAGKLEETIDDLDLADCVELKGNVDFARELSPHLQTKTDLFICCHRQADPSCTYLETLACGIPIVGYRNDAFAGIVDASRAGWDTPMNDIQSLVAKIAHLNQYRSEIAHASKRALTFAHQHSFEETFKKRINQLINLSPQEQELDQTTAA